MNPNFPEIVLLIVPITRDRGKLCNSWIALMVKVKEVLTFKIF